MMIKELGGRVASVWDGLRPVTQKLLTKALQSGLSPTNIPKSHAVPYDAHADWELSRLLDALEEQSRTKETRSDVRKLNEINQLADTCATLLEMQTASAEVFIQLAERALGKNDFKKLDQLAERLTQRFSAAEIAEVVRQTGSPQIRALATECLVHLPPQSIAQLLDDSLYSLIAASALEQQAYEFESDEAREILEQYDSGFIQEG
ncbi:MAG: hypothetical protein ACK4S4_09095 [Pyrinomonadaceae bacterium]